MKAGDPVHYREVGATFARGMTEVCTHAVVAHVWGENVINLSQLDPNGPWVGRTSVQRTGSVETDAPTFHLEEDCPNV